MDDPEQGRTLEESASGTPGPHDGGIDFTHYSQAQLRELQYSIDRRAYPQNFANLLAELQRREEVQAPPAQEPSQPGRFTVRNGLLGWLYAKRARFPVYGPGSIEMRPAEITLHGWQRTWLGVPEQATVSIPMDRICNVARDGSLLRLEWARDYRPRGRVEFQAESAERAARLMEELPATQTAEFQQRWSEVREFNRRLREITPRVWVTPALVLANLAVFIAMAISARRVAGFDSQQLLSWGANAGVYTVNGQLWRLLTALFLHGSLPHLILNMWALWNVGRLAERLFGRWLFALLYFSTGLMASTASIAWDLRTTTLGASGAIFGIFGAFLAFLTRPGTRVPAAVVRAHWLSTLAFVFFNLIGGFLQVGIDNAAHIGGLLSGLVLGWLAARPLDAAQVPRDFPFKQSVAMALVTTGIVLLGLWQLNGVGGQLTVPEQYFRAHQWFVTGEAENLRSWQQLAGSAAAGNISDLQLGRQFEQEIEPFWQASQKRLGAEIASLPAQQRPLATLVAEYARLRLGWATAVADAGKNSDSARAREGIELSKQAALAQARIERIALRAGMDHRARTLSASAPVVALRNLLAANHRKCVLEPAVLRVQTAPADAQKDGPAARQAAGCHAQSLFLSGEYASLQAFVDAAATHLGDLPDGGSTLAGIVGGLDDLFMYGGVDIQGMLERTSDWRRAVGDSPVADLVEAMLFEDWAWSARGFGSAKEVSPQAWALFAYRTEMAAAALHDIRERGTSSPLWYQLSLSVGLDQETDAENLRVTFERGIDKFPAYDPLYRAMLRILMPRWNGSYEKVDELINGVSTKAGPRDKALYARLYWIYASLERDEISIFEDAMALWPTMRAGFTQMVSRYPDSDVVLNAFAKFACVAGDTQQYAALRPQLTKRVAATAWSSKVTLQGCDAKMRFAVSAAR